MFTSDSITLLNLEFNSSCNLRCKWCSLDHHKPRSIMSRDTLRHVMESLTVRPLANLKRIDLHNGGEVLLHPDLPGMLSVIRKYKDAIPGRPVVGMLTNAVALTEQLSWRIVGSRALDQIRFSLDGGSPEAYEDIRRGARWEKVLHNILRFLAVNKSSERPVSTEAICIVPPDVDATAFLSPVFASLFEKFDKVSLRPPHNWDGSADLDVDDRSYRSIAATRRSEVCFLLQHNLVVLPDGSVTVCCNDLNGRGVFASILGRDFISVAQDPERLRMIEMHRMGLRHEVDLCRNCTGFYSHPERTERPSP